MAESEIEAGAAWLKAIVKPGEQYSNADRPAWADIHNPVCLKSCGGIFAIVSAALLVPEVATSLFGEVRP